MQRIVEWLRPLVTAVVLAASACTAVLAANDDARAVKDDAPRIALVIGNTNYSKLTKLRNPGNDARLMAARLKELGFDVVEAYDRDLAGLSKDVDAFAERIRQRGPGTASVVFYAGHGLENESINYLVPVNADIRKRADVRGQALSVKQVADQLSTAGGRLNILIIDACRDNPFPESVAPAPLALGLVPMAAVYGVFIASSTGSGKAAFDGDDDHSPYSRALAEALTAPGEKLEDVFKSVRRQVRLATGERQIPWESTSLELDFYFVPPKPPPPPAAQLLAAAKETGTLALFDLLLDKFPDSPEALEARSIAADLRRAQQPSPAPQQQQPAAALVLDRARKLRTLEAYDLVASLFPGTSEAGEAQEAAAKLREVFALESAGPTYEGRELIQQIQGQLTRLACAGPRQAGVFDAATIQGLRRASLLTDDRYLWHRPTMAALRALRKVDAREGCDTLKLAAAPRCLRINNEDFCQ